MKLKNFLFLMLTLVIVCCSFNITVGAEENIKVMLNDEYINFDVQPQLIKGRTMVPMRAIFEALGAEIEWREESRSVFATKDGVEILIQLDKTQMMVGWKVLELDVPAVEIGGRTLVPVRAVSEAFNCNVEWDEKTYTVKIKTEERQLLLPLDANYITANKIVSVDGEKTYINKGYMTVQGNNLIKWENSDNRDLHASARVYHEMLDDDTEVTLTVRVSEKTKRNEYTPYDTNVVLSKNSEYSDVQVKIPFSRDTWEKYLIDGIYANKPVSICYSLYYGDKFLGETFVDFEYTYASEKAVADKISYEKPILYGINSVGEQVQSGTEYVSYANLARIACDFGLDFKLVDICDENGYWYIFPYKFFVLQKGEELGEGLQAYSFANENNIGFSYGREYKAKMYGDYTYQLRLFDKVVAQADFTVRVP